jgi:hypothetical protein
LLDEAYGGMKHVFVGWYTYSKNNTLVMGSQNPTIYASTRSDFGKQLGTWVEKIVAKDIQESKEGSIEQ